MSFPSVQKYLEAEGVSDPREATPEQIHRALIATFDEDLPLGMAWLREKADVIKRHGHQHHFIEDVSSVLGKQLNRLCGAGVPRRHLQHELGVDIDLYNCCAPVLAPPGTLVLDDIVQIELQNGVLASADC